ncbi:hypothetical protein RMN57_35130 [Kitasatospora sp. CM 4170]|uniref:DUF6745 domain-containing protein n=1 Tax=Kitasatospora aburaviensis TaxID=67265 RepID=A0ABW1EV90_9ACTN|nr:hypothetical protein [Kitasatospora sp. CM 4170]WNM49561.1 hypothetical protein RMN57_35130 [Kitasatospora sp. CM 4170]
MVTDQAVLPAEAAARWRANAAATGTADRAAVERAVRAAYRAAGVAEPADIRWFGSPAAAARAALELRTAGAVSVREAVRTAPWEEARRQAVERVGAAGWSELWALTGGELGPVGNALADRIRDAVLDELAPEPDRERSGQEEVAEARERRTAARLALLDGVRGQHDAPWFAAFEAAGVPLGEPAAIATGPDTATGPDASTAGPVASTAGPDTATAGLAAIAGVARGAGWWWPYEGVALVSERPVALHRDEAGRLDRADGPALEFADGFALHAWRGMPVPAEFLAGLGEVTAERIRTEENAELRRVLLEHYGYERYLADSGAEPLHRDQTGVLWRIQLPDDEPVVMVEVVNSTAEPDGTFRTYWLRVPPSTRTARAGVAWTFGIAEADYRPERET